MAKTLEFDWKSCIFVVANCILGFVAPLKFLVVTFDSVGKSTLLIDPVAPPITGLTGISDFLIIK